MGVRDFYPLAALGEGGQTPQQNFKRNGLNDVYWRKDVPFAVKIATFHNP